MRGRPRAYTRESEYLESDHRAPLGVGELHRVALPVCLRCFAVKRKSKRVRLGRVSFAFRNMWLKLQLGFLLYGLCEHARARPVGGVRCGESNGRVQDFLSAFIQGYKKINAWK